MDSQTGAVATIVPLRRKSKNLLDSWLSSTSHSNSPEPFRLWTAITTIGAALQRRCYLLIQGEPLFCNFFTVLVGPPGVGKTRALRVGKQLLVGLKDMQLSPNALTKEKLIDNLSNGTKIVPLADGKMFSQTAYACYIDELSTFIRYRDYEFMTNLTDMFDCPKIWEYDTLARGTQRIENLFLSIVGGITPKSIQQNWGEAAIGMGFTARLNFIYSEDFKTMELFGADDEPDYSALANDLQIIYRLRGRFRVTPDAAKYLQSWVTEGMPPIPADTRFAEYNPRRSIHWLKLCMVCSVAESDDLIIDVRHAERAKQILLDAEQSLPFVFEHMGQNPLLGAINELHKWLKVEYMASRQPIAEQRIRRRLLSNVPPQYIDSALAEIVHAGLCKIELKPQGKFYVPNLTRTALDDV